MESRLLGLVEQELEQVERFLLVLKKEQDALRVGDIEPVSDINQEKTSLADSLARLGEARRVLLAQVGAEGDRKGTSQWIDEFAPATPLAYTWSRLLAVANEARQVNSLNGQLISMRLAHASQALEVLTHSAQRPTLYGPDGQTSSQSGRRIIDAA